MGIARFTEDVDSAGAREGLEQIHQALEGLGYVRLFSAARLCAIRNAGVKIDFLIAGQFPGDGKPKPVSFPDPSLVGTQLGEMRVINLPALVELKLASGMTGAGRRKIWATRRNLLSFSNCLRNLPSN